jgi:hypothetical protein
MGRTFYGISDDNNDYLNYENVVAKELLGRIAKRIRTSIDNGKNLRLIKQ